MSKDAQELLALADAIEYQTSPVMFDILLSKSERSLIVSALRQSASISEGRGDRDTTCYVERSMVRIGVMGTGDAALLKYVDALPIFTASDFTDNAQAAVDPATVEACAKIAENNGWEATAAQIRDLALPRPHRESGQ